MRTYLIFKEKAQRWNVDPEIQGLLKEIRKSEEPDWAAQGYSAERAASLRKKSFDRPALGARGLAYERLDQLTVEVLLGVR